MSTDKGKSPIQKTVNSKDYEIKISSLSSSPIQSPNKFQVLGNFPPLPYAMTLQTPSAKIQNTSRPQSTSDSSPYFTKRNPEHLLLTTFTEIPDYKTLSSFVNKILPSGCQWIPDDPLKTQRYYELVLVDSGSIELYHSMDKNNPDRISYSKCIIKRVIKPTEWASYATMKDFIVNYIPKGYSYHDYRMAWYRAFLYRPFDHSWFFLPFIQTVKKIFQFGSMSGGIHTDPQQIFYHQQYSKASIPTYSKPKDYTMSRQYSSTENSRFHEFSVGVTELLNIIVLPTNFL